MKILLRCAVALFIAAFPVWSSVAGLHLHGSGPLQFASSLPLGGGGWLVEGDVADDGQILAVTDTFGVWLSPAQGSTFKQIVGCDTMPTANCGFFPRTGGPQILQAAGAASAVAACPQNSAVIYMMYNGFIFKSVNHGSSFVLQPGFNGGAQATQQVNGPYRTSGRKAACDPHNVNHAYISTDANGVQETNDGGTTWAAVSSGQIPTSTIDGSGTYPNYNIAFDKSSGSASNCGPNSNNTCKIYIFNYVNTSGTLTGKLYASINGGTAFTATTGGPTTCTHLIVSRQDGVVWLTDMTSGAAENGGVLWKYSGGTAGTFASFAAQGTAHSVADDPAVSGRILIGDSFGNVNVGTTNGAAWSGNMGHVQTATDIPWLAWTNDFGLSNGDQIFDPTQTNKLVHFAGIGVWSASVPLSGFSTFTWNSITKGIEQMDAQAIRPLPNGNVAVGVQDRAIFVLTPGTYPLQQQTTYKNGIDLAVGSDVDFAKSDPTHMAAIMQPWGGTASLSGSSADTGQTWQPFNSFYTTFLPGAVAIDGSNQWKISVSHSDALLLSSWTPGTTAANSIVRIIGVDAAGEGHKSNSWPITVDTVGNTVTLLGSNNNSNIAPPVAGGTGSYIMYVDTTPTNNGNGAFNVTGAASNGGRVRLTLNNPGFVFGEQTKVCVTGSFGVPNAIGCWVAINVNGNVGGGLDLYGSTFAGTYTSGGTVKTTVRGGGSIAQSTPNNILYLPSDKSFPMCTTDGGLTWTELQFPASAISTTGGADTGWHNGHFLIRHVLTADPVDANTFYGYNDISGIYKFVNCGSPTIVSNGGVALSELFLFSGNNSVLTSVPGRAGHMFFASGPQGVTINGPGSTPLYRSMDKGVTWPTIPNVSNIHSVSCGAIAPGKTYPTCFIVGWADCSQASVTNCPVGASGFTYGIWRSTDADQATPSWTFLVDYPAGNQDVAYIVAADLNIWNRWYLGFGGSSFAYGQQN